MNKKNTIILISIVSAVLLTGITRIVIHNRRKEKLDSSESDIDTDTEINPSEGNGLENTFVETYDRNNQISNPKEELIGKTLYPKSGYVNIREEPKVNNGWVNNIIEKIEGKGTPIGTIVEVTQGTETPPMRWFKVKLNKKVVNANYYFYVILPTTYEYAWVRADVVTTLK